MSHGNSCDSSISAARGAMRSVASVRTSASSSRWSSSSGGHANEGSLMSAVPGRRRKKEALRLSVYHISVERRDHGHAKGSSLEPERPWSFRGEAVKQLDPARELGPLLRRESDGERIGHPRFTLGAELG